MTYTEEQVKEFLKKNNDEWIEILEKKYVRKEVFEKIKNIKIKGVKPSLEIPMEDLLENPLQAFIKTLTKQRNLWNKINHHTKEDEEREMSLKISDRDDEILKALRNQLDLTKKCNKVAKNEGGENGK